ncbi:MAG: nicotinamide riboside transporter PnuC [Steroidobacteraceae bacterium]
MDMLRNALQELLGTSIWEALGVILALLYLVLATARSMWCWLCAFISSVCYVVVMWRAHLVMDAWLSVFYVVMAVYGYWQWRQGQIGGDLQIVSWKWHQHVLAAALVFFATAINAWYLIEHVATARSPWLDSFVTWSSVLTTFMVARRVIENWLYWIVVDGVAAYLYFTRGLNATGLLFIAYVFMVIYGYWAWRRTRTDTTEVTA